MGAPFVFPPTPVPLTASAGVTLPNTWTISQKIFDEPDLRDWAGLDLTGNNDNASLLNRAVTDLAKPTSSGGLGWPSCRIPAGIIALGSTVSVPSGVSFHGQPWQINAGAMVGGTRFHIAHSGYGFILRAANGTDFNVGSRFRDFLTYRDQPTPGAGWAPGNFSHDFWVEGDVTFDDVILLNSTKWFYIRAGGVLTTNRVRGQALLIGFDYERSPDVNRHYGTRFWPSWSQDPSVTAYTMANAYGFSVSRCDGLEVTNAFGIYYKRLFYFNPAAGIGSGVSGFKIIAPYVDQSGGLLEIVSDNYTCYGAVVAAQYSSDVAGQATGAGIRIAGAIPSNVDILSHNSLRSPAEAVVAEGSAHHVRLLANRIEAWDRLAQGSKAIRAGDGAIIDELADPNFGTGGTPHGVSGTTTGTIRRFLTDLVLGNASLSNVTVVGRAAVTAASAAALATAAGLGTTNAPAFASLTLTGSFTQQVAGGSVSNYLNGEGAAQYVASAYVATANGPSMSMRKARGTIAAPAVINSGDTAGLFSFQAYTGAAFANAAFIQAFVIAATPSATDMQGRLSLAVTPAGSTAAAFVAHLENTNFRPATDNAVSLGQSSSRWSASYATHFIAGPFTVATLPAAGVAGRSTWCSNARALLSGGTIQAAGAGTGSWVTDNGTAWCLTGTAITAVA